MNRAGGEDGSWGPEDCWLQHIPVVVWLNRPTAERAATKALTMYIIYFKRRSTPFVCDPSA